MKRTLLATTLAAMALAVPAWAETFEVKMLNKGADGERMVFEPAYLNVQPGDTVKFIATDRGHNAETNKGMVPEGAEGFKGKLNEEIEITFDTEGWYGVICNPHYAMGMVMAIEVGEAELPDDFFEGRVPPKAKERFEAAISQGQ